MPLTPQQRKKLLGHGGLTQAKRRVKRSLSHMSTVNSGYKRDVVAERAIAAVICANHPDVKPEDVFPPMPTTAEILQSAVTTAA